MATETQRRRFLRNVGLPSTDTTTWPSEDIDDLFAEALEDNPGATDKLLLAVATLKGIRAMMADSSKRASYTQASSSENLSDVNLALARLEKVWSGEVDKLSGTVSSVVRWGEMQPKPTRLKEWPDA